MSQPGPSKRQHGCLFFGCIAGAISIEDYRSGLRDAGFSDVEVVDSGGSFYYVTYEDRNRVTFSVQV